MKYLLIARIIFGIAGLYSLVRSEVYYFALKVPEHIAEVEKREQLPNWNKAPDNLKESIREYPYKVQEMSEWFPYVGYSRGHRSVFTVLLAVLFFVSLLPSIIIYDFEISFEALFTFLAAGLLLFEAYRIFNCTKMWAYHSYFNATFLWADCIFMILLALIGAYSAICAYITKRDDPLGILDD